NQRLSVRVAPPLLWASEMALPSRLFHDCAVVASCTQGSMPDVLTQGPCGSPQPSGRGRIEGLGIERTGTVMAVALHDRVVVAELKVQGSRGQEPSWPW